VLYLRAAGRHLEHRHHEVYQDEETIAFVAPYPTLRGYCLVAPKRHVESWVHDLDEAAFLRLQAVVRRIATAIAATVSTERMYALSLGSQQGNAHLHWHVAPLPSGIPYVQQPPPVRIVHSQRWPAGPICEVSAAQMALAPGARVPWAAAAGPGRADLAYSPAKPCSAAARRRDAIALSRDRGGNLLTHPHADISDRGHSHQSRPAAADGAGRWTLWPCDRSVPG
jgi:diadenosine tetraphosphate (Ap4A) HIT family hydrolase